MTATIERPTARRVRFDGIPAELTKLRQWCCWRYELRASKYTKVPYQPNGYKAESDDATTWCDFATVKQAYLSRLDADIPGMACMACDDEPFDGIGCFFSAADSMVGVDLDKCIGPDGELSDDAAQVVSDLNTYTEVSPSGAGVKLWATGGLPTEQGGRRTRPPGWAGDIEMYQHGRYFAVTGHSWPGTTTKIVDQPKELAGLFKRFFGDADANKPSAQPVTIDNLTFAPDAEPDRELLHTALCNNPDFAAVWNRVKRFPCASRACGSIVMHLVGHDWPHQQILNAWISFRRRIGELPEGKESLRKFGKYDLPGAIRKVGASDHANRNGYSGNGQVVKSPATTSTPPKQSGSTTDKQSATDTVAYRWLTFNELMAGDFRQNYLVNNVVTEAQGGIISGRFKTLKTTIAVDLFVSIASGLPFLGRFDVPAAVPCAIMTAESGLATIQGLCRRVVKSKLADAKIDRYRNYPDAAEKVAQHENAMLANLLLSPSCPRLTRLDHLEALERVIGERGLKCMAVDPTYLAFCDIGDSSSNVFKMGMVLEPLTRLIEKTGCTIILLNHNRKGRGQEIGKFDPPELTEISMSGFAEWMRFWLLLGPRQEWDEEERRHWLWMRTGGSAGHAGLWGLDVCEGSRGTPPPGAVLSEYEKATAGHDPPRMWQVSVDVAPEVRKADKSDRESRKEAEKRAAIEEKKRAICEFLKTRNGEPANQEAIKNHLGAVNGKGISSTVVGGLIAQLIDDGVLSSVDIRKGKSTHGFVVNKK